MFAEVVWFPKQASTTARSVDDLFWFLFLVCGSVGLLVAGLLITFAVRYRRRPGTPTPGPMRGNVPLEIFWTVTPLFVFLAMFVWGAVVYFDAFRAPDDAIGRLRRRQAVDVEVPAPRGPARDQRAARPRRQADQADDDLRGRDPQLLRARLPRPHGRAARPLHVGLVRGDPAGDVPPVLLPVLRHQPRGHGRHGSSSWSRPSTRSGCSTVPRGRSHSRAGRSSSSTAASRCHSADAEARAPVLEELFGKRVPLRDGRTVIADEQYLRESILNPHAKIVAGYEDIMPTFKGQLTRAGDRRTHRVHPGPEEGPDPDAGGAVPAARQHHPLPTHGSDRHEHRRQSPPGTRSRRPPPRRGRIT